MDICNRSSFPSGPPLPHMKHPTTTISLVVSQETKFPAHVTVISLKGLHPATSLLKEWSQNGPQHSICDLPWAKQHHHLLHYEYFITINTTKNEMSIQDGQTILLIPVESMVNKPIVTGMHSPGDAGQTGTWTKQLSWKEEKGQELWSHRWLGIQVLPLTHWITQTKLLTLSTFSLLSYKMGAISFLTRLIWGIKMREHNL